MAGINEQDQKPVEGDEFDSAFAERTGEEGKGEKPDAGKSTDEKPDGKAEAPILEKPDEKIEEKPAEKLDDKPAEALDDTPAAITPDLYKKEVQRKKSLEGMYNSELKKREALEKELEEYRKVHKREGADDQPAAPPAARKDDEKPVDIADIFSDLPTGKPVSEDFEDIYKFQLDTFRKYDEIMLKRLSWMAQTFSKQLAPVSETIATTADEKHFKAIADAGHPDFETIVDSEDFVAWEKSLPAGVAANMERIVNEGDASECIWMLNQYKKDRGMAVGKKSDNGGGDDEEDTLSDEKRERLEDLAPVTSRKAPIKTRGGGFKNKDDYDGSFEEAVAKKI